MLELYTKTLGPRVLTPTHFSTHNTAAPEYGAACTQGRNEEAHKIYKTLLA